MNKEEQSYLNLLRTILETGSIRKNRTGVDTIGIFGTQLRFSLENNKIPAITTKKIFIRGVIEELLFFLRGESNSKILESKGINVWKGNTTREFLDKTGLQHLPEGDMGKLYGYQYRKWGSKIDQITKTIELLKNDPYSRRIIVSTWNVENLDEMCLNPCIPLFQLYVNNGELSLQWYQRSVDYPIGAPWNILSYAILAHIFAKVAKLKAKEIIFVGGDVHCYTNCIDQIKEQLSREPYEFPTLTIEKDIDTIEDIEKLEYKDFIISNYKFHPPIKMEMIA